MPLSSSQPNGPVQSSEASTPPINPNAVTVGSWDRGYNPNANWQPSNGQQSTEEWAGYGQPTGQQQQPAQQSSGHQPPTQPMEYEQTFNAFNPHQGFQPPAPVAQTGDPFSGSGNNNNNNSFSRPRPSPQPATPSALHGGFSPHLSSPHPSPGGSSAQHMNGNGNGRCSSVGPPHTNQQQQHFVDSAHSNGSAYMNGSPFASPSPRPPSSNVPPPVQLMNSTFEPVASGNGLGNGGDAKSFRVDVVSQASHSLTGHPNANPGYLSPAPQQSSRNSSGYPGQSTTVKGEQQQKQLQQISWEQQQKHLHDVNKSRNIQHDELNNRLKEKILNKQQQQQCNIREQPNAFQQHMHQHGIHQQSEHHSNGNSQQQYYVHYTPYHEDYGEGMNSFGGNEDSSAGVTSDINERAFTEPAPTSGSGLETPSSSKSTAPSNVRLDVHVENQQSSSPAHFLGTAHPQGGSGGGDRPKEPATTSPNTNNSLTTSSTTTPNGLLISPLDEKIDTSRVDHTTSAGNCLVDEDSNCVIGSTETLRNKTDSTLRAPLSNGQSGTGAPCVVVVASETSSDASNCADANVNQRVSSKPKSNIKDEVPQCQCFPSDQCKSPSR